MEFNTAIDIANRALQHCGAARIDPALGFSENGRNASETSFVYGKLRRAELQSRVWTFATRRQVLRPLDTTTMRLIPALWSVGATYFVGSIVTDQNGTMWISRQRNNIGNDPQNTLAWEPYFGPLSVSLWGSGTSYFAGELAYTTPGDGTSKIYLSRQNANTDDPGAATIYDAATTYMKDQVTTFNSVAYLSLIDFNAGNQPDQSPAPWAAGTTYATGDKVSGSDGTMYESATSGNTGNDPTLDDGTNWTNLNLPTPWTTTFVGGAGSDKWLLIGGADFPAGVGIESYSVTYPVDTGPASDFRSRNVFQLPAGHLRKAPQNPKPGLNWSGGPSGTQYDDWLYEGEFLLTAEFGPLTYRFVADVSDVRAMDDMFCEGLSARVALEVCEPLTQSSAKLGTIAKIYDEWMSRAKAANAIEEGYDDPPDDDYVTVRY